MSQGPFRQVFGSGTMTILTNIPGFKWPSAEEKIAGLLESGLIDQAEADWLRAKHVAPPTITGQSGEGEGGR